MDKKLRNSLATTAAVLAAAAASVVPASAASAPSSASSSAPSSASSAPATASALSNLTMTKSGAVSKQVTLQCDPAGGTHPTPGDACAALTSVYGQFALLPSVPGVGCTAEYNPVTVTVTGYWQLRAVYFSKVFSNNCEAAVESNWVFRF
ncbi:SSI family serine proteinase inhibitor [Streptomyces sp. HPF1205]|uniref:SSI family serine proteinase inhibitor n=1 Tax=Streptomyces sp. HPF1205 TaxID=2873262 RepID=UPI001CED0AF5|nr:SSI family serine proteinase inhibitor [Streptomyces sp. HPF1205]